MYYMSVLVGLQLWLVSWGSFPKGPSADSSPNWWWKASPRSWMHVSTVSSVQVYSNAACYYFIYIQAITNVWKGANLSHCHSVHSMHATLPACGLSVDSHALEVWPSPSIPSTPAIPCSQSVWWDVVILCAACMYSRVRGLVDSVSNPACMCVCIGCVTLNTGDRLVGIVYDDSQLLSTEMSPKRDSYSSLHTQTFSVSYNGPDPGTGWWECMLCVSLYLRSSVDHFLQTSHPAAQVSSYLSICFTETEDWLLRTSGFVCLPLTACTSERCSDLLAGAGAWLCCCDSEHPGYWSVGQSNTTHRVISLRTLLPVPLRLRPSDHWGVCGCGQSLLLNGFCCSLTHRWARKEEK